MTKKLVGVFEPVFKGKHVSEMSEDELDEFADWIAATSKGRAVGEKGGGNGTS